MVAGVILISSRQLLEIRHRARQELAQPPPNPGGEATAILVFQQDALRRRAQKLLGGPFVLHHRKIQVAGLEGQQGVRAVETQIRAIHQPVLGAVRRLRIAELGAQDGYAPTHQPARDPIKQHQ